MGIRMGVCGVGSFAECFIPLFKAHPGVENVVLCDLDAAKLAARCEQFGIADRAASLDELCGMDLEAIAIITQHHLHGPQAVQALRANKHVYSAVPSAITVSEMTALVRAVEETGRVYMVGETSTYYPCAIYCRERFRRGDFGHAVYAEAEYYHDYAHGLYDVARSRHGADWERWYGMPPLFYPTHSTSMVVSVTGAHALRVAGMGFTDRHPDGLYSRPDNVWRNPLSNETVLCAMSDGSVARLNEFRRVGHPGTVGMSLYGTEASYEEQVGGKMWVTKDRSTCEDVSARLACRDITFEGRLYRGVSDVHPLERLPAAFDGLPNSHEGSHQFLVHDFVMACLGEPLEMNHVWDAARYLLPGLTGHASALNGGALLDVPDLGDAPARQA